MEDFLGPLLIFAILVFFIAISTVIALTRWIFRINEQIEILSQIRDELKKLNSVNQSSA